ncbi:MAG TPA: hypothetical protein VFB59_00715 [Candidatus Saccharimonadales bacterium]|nr:hypothetical protein [Candidatus Saccharimonadales bacterium]
MEHGKHTLPTPSKAAVAKWLRQLNRQKLHDEGWVQANKRFYTLTMMARPFIQQHFETPEEQKAAFDGLALALITLSHFDDIQALERLLNTPKAKH